MAGEPKKSLDLSPKKKNPSFFVLLTALFLLLGNNMILSAQRPVLLEVTENSLCYSFFFDQPTITEVQLNNQTFTKIEMPECFPTANPGSPILPIYRAVLLLPKDGLVENIQVTYQNPQKIPIDTIHKPILPEQEFIRIGMQQQPAFIMNDSLYSQSRPVSENIYEDGGIGYCRGYALQTLYLYPVQYMPAIGILTYFPEMTVILTLAQNQDQRRSIQHAYYRSSETDEDLIRDMVANPAIISTYDSFDENVFDETDDSSQNHPFSNSSEDEGRLNGDYPGGLCSPPQHYDYVIITSDSLKQTTGYPYNWSSLLTHRKTYNDLDGIIVTVQEIESCHDYWNSTPTFNDSQARIREFCKDAYLDWDTEYILLGGDWDSTASHQIVPYRLFTDREETETYNTMACDKYYSHLDGTWYYSAQSIWGGGRSSGVNDYYAELYVGRIAAYNASMVSNAVQKIIWYDLVASGEWLTQVSFFGGNLGWSVTAKQYMEELRLGSDTYRSFTGFEEWNSAHPEDLLDTSERLYHADLGSTYKTYFSNSIQNNNASIINHLDHSDYNTPFGLTNWLYRYNTKPFFGYTQGCLAGRFHAGYAGSEQLMCRHPDRHAFALVLNTGYGYGSSSSTNGPSQYIHSYFYDYFFNNQSSNQNNWQLGKAVAYANQKMSARIDISSHAWCYAWYSAHFFGDPAQILRIQQTDSEQIYVSNENPTDTAINLPLTQTTVSVTIHHSQGHPFTYTIQTVPPIGSTSESTALNGTKSCNISGLAYETTYTWFVNVTDGTTWNNNSYQFTTEDAPVNNPPLITNPFPIQNATEIPLNSTVLSIQIQDLESDPITWMITTSPDIGSHQETNATNGTKYCTITGLVSSTTYTWFVNVSDGVLWTNKSYRFTTEQTDSTPPQITTITMKTSDPLDIQPGFGWENISCKVTDDHSVDTVLLNITYPNSTTISIQMHHITSSTIYYYNTTLTQYGNYTYHLWANDTRNNQISSNTSSFTLSPNWDINADGNCSLMDLVFVSNKYGQIGPPGWIREDIDNNGTIEVFDLVLLSNQYGNSW